jgi:hypothetical protein
MYNNAKDFADSIKVLQYQPLAGSEDMDLRISFLKANYPEEFLSYKYILERNYGPTQTTFQEVIDDILDQFYSILNPDQVELFKSKCYFSTIDNREVNAFVKLSEDKRFCAILINSSLIKFLHRWGKLDFAILDPDSVLFCSGFTESKPTKEDLMKVRENVFNSVYKTKIPHIPFIILKNELINKAQLAQLSIQEKFVVFHEIAHIMNGDLTKQINNPDITSRINKASHCREYWADLVAFGLLLKLEMTTYSKEIYELISTHQRHLFLYAIINLFKTITFFQEDVTYMHPHPINRMYLIIEYFYGVEIADLVEQALKEKKIHELTPESLPEIVSHEKEVLEHIDNCLNHFWQRIICS